MQSRKAELCNDFFTPFLCAEHIERISGKMPRFPKLLKVRNEDWVEVVDGGGGTKHGIGKAKLET